MSNIDLIIEERAVSIGSFMVGRLLPFRQKRMVGPFIYLDHMGPAYLNENENFDVLPHPHIGLSTLTYLLEGSVMHRDSLGNVVEIKPGEVNWMTSGKGITHSERTPDYLRNQKKNMHGLQIWVALPKNLEEMDPEFAHIGSEGLPKWEENGVFYTLVAGKYGLFESKVPVYSPLFLIEISAQKESVLNIGKNLFGESAIYIIEGEVEIEGMSYGPKQLLVSMNPEICSFTIKENTRLFIFGGEAFPEERIIDWNFVSTNKDLIDKAKALWEKQEFPKINGEEGFIPLPSIYKLKT